MKRFTRDFQRSYSKLHRMRYKRDAFTADPHYQNFFYFASSFVSAANQRETRLDFTHYNMYYSGSCVMFISFFSHDPTSTLSADFTPWRAAENRALSFDESGAFKYKLQ